MVSGEDHWSINISKAVGALDGWCRKKIDDWLHDAVKKQNARDASRIRASPFSVVVRTDVVLLLEEINTGRH